MNDDDVRTTLLRHWAAADTDDFATEHAIYADDAVLDYPQSNERLPGLRAIQASRMAQPDRKRFTVRRISGSGDLWVSELVVTYGGQPSHVVSIMTFVGDRVVQETQYFAAPFAPGPSRVQWVVPIA